MTNKEKKDVLLRARDAVLEIDSLEESIRTIEARLYSGPSASPIRFRDGSFDDEKTVELLEDRHRTLDALRFEYRQVSEAIAQASQIISSTRHAPKRAALRYYYLCRKSYAYIADVLGCDERTIRRWVSDAV